MQLYVAQGGQSEETAVQEGEWAIFPPGWPGPGISFGVVQSVGPKTSLVYDVFSTESAPPTASARLSLRLNRAGSASTGGGSRRMPLSSLSARDSIPESGASNGPAALRAACDGHSAMQADAAWLTRYRPPRLARACRMSRP